MIMMVAMERQESDDIDNDDMNLCQRGEKLTFTAIVDKLRGHTCTFNPAMRDKTLAQILQPTNLAMHYNWLVMILMMSVMIIIIMMILLYNSDAEMGRTRIDINLNNLVLNVFPGSLKIILDRLGLGFA